MIQYTLDSVKRMGAPHEKFGSAYWCTSAESDLPIKFNSMNADLEHELESGPLTIVAEEKEEKESAKGTAYISLRKVKLVEKPTQASESKITPELVKETFGDEKPAQKDVFAGKDYEGSARAYVGAKPPAQSAQTSQLDRIEAQLQELQSSIDELRGV